METVQPKERTASRVWLAGPLSTGLGLVAHVAAGGPVPSLMILAAVAALMGMAAAMVGRFSLPGWAVLLACGLAQQLLHLGFAAFSGGSGEGLSGHGHGGNMQNVDTAQGPRPAVEAASPAGYSLQLMLHVHMAAALAAYAVMNYWPSFTRWPRRVQAARQKSPAA
ncbi:hypothetical protein QFZ36_002999 [Pseudarthrobacter siccitolerans]|uniref:Uncharacterized protein n=1 Tax=Pseudarthrobacter siccitolerans TaxID=861266 RepID=A0ABU0PNC0_9MICC|nr:hypothetical protein [Pseudarthrobacter siccitolerans]MDQ0675438.1 hypothetical protein [Pseudarthrobacter siccitolerans]